MQYKHYNVIIRKSKNCIYHNLLETSKVIYCIPYSNRTSFFWELNRYAKEFLYDKKIIYSLKHANH